MGPEVRGELGRLRVLDLLREAEERSARRSARRAAGNSDKRSTRRPAPRTGDEA